MTEYRVASGEIRALNDATRQFEATVCNYNVVDSYGTTWAPGVFTRSLESKLPKAVWAHDWHEPIGRVVSYDDNAERLNVTVQLDSFEDVPRARQTHSQLKSGSLTDFSFGFVRGKDMKDPNHPGATLITEAQLDEVSPVLVGAVPGTRTIAVRSAQDGHVETVRVVTEADLQKALPTAGSKMVLTRTAHKYQMSDGVGSKCKVCGEGLDSSQHRRVATGGEIRALSTELAEQPPTQNDDDGSAVGIAVGAAINLAAQNDVDALPEWAIRMVALIQTADAYAGDWSDTPEAADVARAVCERHEEVRIDPPADDPEILATMARLEAMATRGRHPFAQAVSIPIPPRTS